MTANICAVLSIGIRKLLIDSTLIIVNDSIHISNSSFPTVIAVFIENWVQLIVVVKYTDSLFKYNLMIFV